VTAPPTPPSLPTGSTASWSRCRLLLGRWLSSRPLVILPAADFITQCCVQLSHRLSRPLPTRLAQRSIAPGGTASIGRSPGRSAMSIRPHTLRSRRAGHWHPMYELSSVERAPTKEGIGGGSASRRRSARNRKATNATIPTASRSGLPAKRTSWAAQLRPARVTG
jgi:hypothetical protein